MANPGFHFLAIPGSLRSGSYTRAIAGSLDELAPDDVGVELFGQLGEFPLYDQDVQDREMPDVVVQAGALVKAADAIILVTPEYNHSIPGVLKNGLDWLSRLADRPLQQKPVAIQSASPGALGGARAQEHVRQVLVAMDARVLNRPEVIITAVTGKIDGATGRLTDLETRQQVGRQLHALAGLVRVPVPGAG